MSINGQTFAVNLAVTSNILALVTKALTKVSNHSETEISPGCEEVLRERIVLSIGRELRNRELEG